MKNTDLFFEFSDNCRLIYCPEKGCADLSLSYIERACDYQENDIIEYMDIDRNNAIQLINWIMEKYKITKDELK